MQRSTVGTLVLAGLLLWLIASGVDLNDLESSDAGDSFDPAAFDLEEEELDDFELETGAPDVGDEPEAGDEGQDGVEDDGLADTPEWALLRLAGERREAAGLEWLEPDAALFEAASAHAVDMAAVAGCSHEGSDGSSVEDRLSRADYGWSRYGENVACGSRSPAQAMAQWEASPAHLKNLLDDRFTEVGIGIAPQTGGRAMWVMVFGKPRDD